MASSTVIRVLLAGALCAASAQAANDPLGQYLHTTSYIETGSSDSKPKSKSQKSVESLSAALTSPDEAGEENAAEEAEDEHKADTAVREAVAEEVLDRRSKASKVETHAPAKMELMKATGKDEEKPETAPARQNLRASSNVPKEAKESDEEEASGKELVEAAALSNTSSMEQTLTDLMLSGGKLGATPFGKSVKQITDLITGDMMPKVLHAHKENQEKLNELAESLHECGKTRHTQTMKADKKKVVYLKTSPLHKTCRAGEAGQRTALNECVIEQRDKKNIMTLKCKEFAMVSKDKGDQNKNRNAIQKAGNEGVETYVRRLSATFCGSKFPKKGQGGYGAGGFLDEFLIAKDGCNMATHAYMRQKAKCEQIKKEYDLKKEECDGLQDQMDNAACKRAVDMKDACETYAECYLDRRKAYDMTHNMVKTEERDRKAEWRGLQRMSCLMTAFGDGKVKKSEVDECKKRTINTDLLNIIYPPLTPMMPCTVPDRYPSTPAYKLAEFASLPSLAKGKEDANVCTGVIEIPTKPREGSPKSCKCERITLNGPYSAGPLVKCSHCLEARRTTEKNSCPDGTKIFSPRSDEDWKTFFASVDDITMDPFFIVDVTNKKPGCGLCKKAAMNSGPGGQGAAWGTSDGSPWWLRSDALTAAKGISPTYQPHCYLGLSVGRARDVADIMPLGNRCKQHAKSYFCQLKEQVLVPKPGSPAACKCENVVLTDAYSAGALIKCTGCLDVHRSAQKNSCPEGTKIFSPANSRDWKTFLDSAKPLRSPNWIIDVTRPQNGCGGCKKFPMKSTSPAQMTWRTADSSPWWLRSTTYSEPNGDYKANCYMDLWKTPPSENSVLFNDGNCNYHSNGYYCQPVKKKENEDEESSA